MIKNIAYKIINASCNFLMSHFDQFKLAIGQKGRKTFSMNKEGNITNFSIFQITKCMILKLDLCT